MLPHETAGTGVAYLLNYSIVSDAGATVASASTYAIPALSTLAGVLVLNEPLTWNEPSTPCSSSAAR